MWPSLTWSSFAMSSAALSGVILGKGVYPLRTMQLMSFICSGQTQSGGIGSQMFLLIVVASLDREAGERKTSVSLHVTGFLAWVQLVPAFNFNILSKRDVEQNRKAGGQMHLGSWELLSKLFWVLSCCFN